MFGIFGKRKAPSPFRQPSVDSDGKRRIFGEAIFAGKHGDMLRSLGFDLNDPANIVPDAAEFDRRIKDSLARQDARRTEIETELLRTHGHNAIRPFFILAQPVFNGPLGQWLIRQMKLLPYDDWNVVYLPLDLETRKAMGGELPLHPRQSIGPIDELMCKQIGDFFNAFQEVKRKLDAHVAKVGIENAVREMNEFVAFAESLPPKILDHVARVRPIVIALIADVQRKALN